MRIRAALLALTATVVAGSAIAAAATPAAAQEFYRPVYERGYAPAYRYERPRFDYRWGYAPPVYGYGYYHPYHYRHFWR